MLLKSIGMFATRAVYVSDGAAIGGYDPVAYFVDSKPVKGSKEIFEDWNGARWLFVSTENRDRFRNAPEQYAPQFGGYCAYAVSHEYTAKTDPAAFTIVDDKLYLNYDLDTQKEWLAQRDTFITDGHRNWPKVLW
ncbi:YHS domain-containing (seleno)protein [Nevskia sp.]|uniref:YHS domain-containing (seleno)protein n=1 Tax=Nevskia sp. TaxID=1929292 RepID=UPI0025FA1245|nr:YHS domain-containing (seleno)protein [Nevskia sp.]